MKLNDNIEEYDVKSLSSIISSVEDILELCKGQENAAEAIAHNISIAEMNFNSENMQRAKEIIKKFSHVLGEAEREFKELLASVNAYAEKLRRSWRPW